MNEDAVEKLLKSVEIECDPALPKSRILAAAAREVAVQRRLLLMRYAAAACLLVSVGFWTATWRVEKEIAQITRVSGKTVQVSTNGFEEIPEALRRYLHRTHVVRGRILARRVRDMRSIMPQIWPDLGENMPG